MNNSHHSQQSFTNRDTRFCFNYPWKPVNIKPLGEAVDELNGLMIDHSSSGIGILSLSALDVGTKVVINLPGNYSAIGIVKNAQATCGQWESSGLVRMGIKFER